MTNYDSQRNVLSAYSNLGYDGAGNLLASTVTLASLPQQMPLPPFTTGTIHYAYDNLDHLTQEQSQRNIVFPGSGVKFRP